MQVADKSFGLSSPALGTAEAYLLEDCPVAISMGKTVMGRNMPFIWVHPDLPYHCTGPSQLKITCPRKHRRYADRVEENTPIWKETVKLSCYNKAGAAINYLVPGAAGEVRAEAPPEVRKHLPRPLRRRVRQHHRARTSSQSCSMVTMKSCGYLRYLWKTLTRPRVTSLSLSGASLGQHSWKNPHLPNTSCDTSLTTRTVKHATEHT